MTSHMQEIEATYQGEAAPAKARRISGRWIFLAASALTLLLLGVLPPLIGVNRYQHRISTSIGASLGRPVHFDHVSLNLLPLPSFTITNFVVEEDPAFGAEPIIRANTVVATLRVSSLWRRRVEFSRISFDAPSVNLVHDASGKWNVQGILLQAAQIQTAPTGQRNAGSAPRFPYIEATGARLNLKQGIEKTPFSLTDADFALWQPDPQVWKMRLEGRPVRTDTSVSDTGSLQIEATLGHAGALEAVPLDLQATWRNAPLGEASRLILARDLGLRGEMTVSATVHGNLDRNSFETRVQVNRLRRSDFVPEQTVSVDMQCNGTMTRVFHAIPDVRCSWPVPDSDGALLALAGSIPDLLQLGSADVQAGVSKLPAEVLLNWLRVASSRISPKLSAAGLLSGSVSHDPESGGTWGGQATVAGLRLSGGRLGPAPVTIDDLFLHSGAPVPTSSRAPDKAVNLPTGYVVLSPTALSLGGKEAALLEGQADGSGYTLHLSGVVVLNRLAALAAAIPQIGDGLAEVLPTNRASGPVRVDLSAHRAWGDGQTWTDNLTRVPIIPVRKTHTMVRARAG